MYSKVSDFNVTLILGLCSLALGVITLRPVSAKTVIIKRKRKNKYRYKIFYVNFFTSVELVSLKLILCSLFLYSPVAPVHGLGLVKGLSVEPYLLTLTSDYEVVSLPLWYVHVGSSVNLVKFYRWTCADN